MKYFVEYMRDNVEKQSEWFESFDKAIDFFKKAVADGYSAALYNVR